MSDKIMVPSSGTWKKIQHATATDAVTIISVLKLN
jgi:hypothetical protein